ncbi:RnfH family protein [Pseudoduganella danionis]|uniref:RnfH family protein n=1 Tax=Pseudoduganella danionis TaxID=1890295 RepID=UPI0035B42C3B
MADDALNIEVCYASDDVQFLQALQVPAGSTIAQAIALSDLQQRLPQLDLQALQVGIYAKKKTLDTVLREHDRIELYRPLIADPKHARRRRKASV